MSKADSRFRFRTGGLAAWSIRRPVSVIMLSLAVVVLGVFSLERLAIDLLPHIIYPEIQVRIIDRGVPSTVMEDRITRQLEEQLAITEDAISVQSRSQEGRSSVALSFEYGKDIDIALRDASTRLDRAKRFLPTSIDPPVIFKRDPSQIPIAEFVVSSSLRDSVELRDWVDKVFAKWFLNLPGVAAVEVGGGLEREIHVVPDQQRMHGLGLSMDALVTALERGNVEAPVGRLYMHSQQIASRTAGRFSGIEQIADLPLRLPGGEIVYLREVAQVIDTHEDEGVRVRYNDIPGVKISIQRQPNANTVNVVDAVRAQLTWLREQKLIPEHVEIHNTQDQSVYVRNSLNNAALAAFSGAMLAMLVVYLFLGSLRRTLIIGSAIPIAIMVTFIIMALGGLSLNVMTLGGLALGVGMLVDNTIVMLENIFRHQRESAPERDAQHQAAVDAAGEVNSAIVASTSTNLAAVLPFLFIGGLVGLLFRELIFTISAAILASMMVALTLIPALATRAHTIRRRKGKRVIDRLVDSLRHTYADILGWLLRHTPARVVLMCAFAGGLAASLIVFTDSKEIFLPKLDDGQVHINIAGDPGMALDDMDAIVSRIEALLHKQPEVEGVFSLVGGRIFGRSEYEASNRSTLYVQLVPRSQRKVSSEAWKDKIRTLIGKQEIAGIRVRVRTRGIRGIRTSRGDDDISIRVRGPDLAVLNQLGDEIVQRLKDVKGLRNLEHSNEELRQEISIEIDRERAAALGLDVEDIGRGLRFALEGEIVTDFIDGDRAYDVRVRLDREDVSTPQEMESLLLYPSGGERPGVYLRDVASIRLLGAPAQIQRDRQQRIVEISASVNESQATLGNIAADIDARLADMQLPPGYNIYDGGSRATLEQSRRLAFVLMGLALFLVFVVMAVQYESLRNPLVILIGVPFAATGVAIGLTFAGKPLSMPVWLGMIMLAGIVVNNAIVLIEYIEIVRARGVDTLQAIIEAARLRLRPILMTTLTTVVGMLPLALGWGDGAEMLQPLAVTIVYGLAWSMLVTLFLIPMVYHMLHGTRQQTVPAGEPSTA